MCERERERHLTEKVWWVLTGKEKGRSISHRLLLLLLFEVMVLLLLLLLSQQLSSELLSVSGLVILKPIEDVLPFNPPKSR